jgi:hypothetical protein
MSQTIPTQHPAVVLRSHYTHLRTLLAIAMIAVVGLTAAVVILAIDDNGATGTSAAQPLSAPTQPPAVQRFDNGRPDEGTRGPVASPVSPTTRYFGSAEDGTSGTGH